MFFFLYCDICKLYLCKVCVDEYFLDFIEYKVVLFEKWRFIFIYFKCFKYFIEYCEFFCELCDIFICLYCVFGKYLGYKVISILKSLKVKKKVI